MCRWGNIKAFILGFNGIWGSRNRGYRSVGLNIRYLFFYDLEFRFLKLGGE